MIISCIQLLLYLLSSAAGITDIFFVFAVLGMIIHVPLLVLNNAIFPRKFVRILLYERTGDEIIPLGIPLVSGEIILFIESFIVGALLGWLYGIIKNRKTNS